MKEYFSQLSKSIEAIIKSYSSSYSTKEFEHLTCDGAVCDAKHHQILFEDNIIRVINVTLAAKEDERFHRHERCAIMYVDMPASIEYYEKPEDPKQISWSSKNLEPRFNVIPSEAMHKVKNVDSKPFCAFRIEINADILKLQKHDAILKEIQELVILQKSSLDSIRQKISAQSTAILNQFPTRKARTISKREVAELESETKRFCKR